MSVALLDSQDEGHLMVMVDFELFILPHAHLAMLTDSWVSMGRNVYKHIISGLKGAAVEKQLLLSIIKYFARGSMLLTSCPSNGISATHHALRDIRYP